MGILVVVMSSRPSTAGTYRPSTAGSYRPSSAGTYRSSSSVIGAHGKTNKFAATKSRYQRPQSAPVGGRNKNKTTNTASKIFRHNGDTYAVKHQHKLTGYKLSHELGEDVRAETTTTNQLVYQKPRMPTIAAPANRKPLVPYRDNARRSQLPVEFPKEAKKYVRYCHERNTSQLVLGDPKTSSVNASASRVFHCGLKENAVIGSSNSGIFSEWTKRQRKSREI